MLDHGLGSYCMVESSIGLTGEAVLHARHASL